MTRIKLTNTKGRETAAKRRESGVTANYQMRKIIGGILGEEGKDRMYEERGAGRRKKGPARQDEAKTEDKQRGWTGGRTKTSQRDWTATRSRTCQRGWTWTRTTQQG